MAPQKLQAGSDMPKVTLPMVGGGEVSTGADNGWKMAVVFPGRYATRPERSRAPYGSGLAAFAARAKPAIHTLQGPVAQQDRASDS
jgi:hypothetical protein